MEEICGRNRRFLGKRNFSGPCYGLMQVNQVSVLEFSTREDARSVR